MKWHHIPHFWNVTPHKPAKGSFPESGVEKSQPAANWTETSPLGPALDWTTPLETCSLRQLCSYRSGAVWFGEAWKVGEEQEQRREACWKSSWLEILTQLQLLAGQTRPALPLYEWIQLLFTFLPSDQRAPLLLLELQIPWSFFCSLLSFASFPPHLSSSSSLPSFQAPSCPEATQSRGKVKKKTWNFLQEAAAANTISCHCQPFLSCLPLPSPSCLHPKPPVTPKPLEQGEQAAENGNLYCRSFKAPFFSSTFCKWCEWRLQSLSACSSCTSPSTSPLLLAYSIATPCTYLAEPRMVKFLLEMNAFSKFWQGTEGKLFLPWSGLLITCLQYYTFNVGEISA